MYANPDAAVLDDGTGVERAIVERLRTEYYDFPAATPDPDFVDRKRGMLVALAAMYAAPNVVPGEDEDWFIDPSACASSWLGAIADHAYSLPADANDAPLYGLHGGVR